MTKWKLQGNKEDYSFDLIDADCGDLLPTEKNFTEGKIERTKIVEKVGRPFFKYWKK